MYGDADPLNAEQWFGLSLPNPTSSRTWSDRTSTCSNMFTGKTYGETVSLTVAKSLFVVALEVQFLVASTGEKYNPQNKIIAASAAITTADWVMR